MQRNTREPFILAGSREYSAVFSVKGPFGYTEWIQTGDTGIGSLSIACDLDQDEKEEVLIFNRKELHIFKINS